MDPTTEFGRPLHRFVRPGLSSSPIAWLPLLMCDRHNHDLVCSETVEDVERERLQNEAPGTMFCHGVSVWGFDNPIHGLRHIAGKSCRAQRAAFLIPYLGFPEFASRRWMKSNCHVDG